MRLSVKHILSIVLLSLCTLVAKAQFVDISNYSFVDKDADTIAYYGQSASNFKPFYRAFRSMIIGGQRQINIYHIGDSHLQADLFTGQVRKNIQSFMPGLSGARGMLTPFMKGGPDSYSLSYSNGWSSTSILSSSDSDNKGLWGTSVYTSSTNQSINIKVNHRNPVKYDFNTFRVYHSALNEGDNLIVDDLNVGYSKRYNVEEGYTEFNLSDYVSEIKIVIEKSSLSTFYVYGFYFDNQEGGVVYNVTGTNGVGASHYNNAKLFTPQLASLNADLVVISLGTNDTYEPGGENTFEQNLSKLISNVRKAHANIPIILVTPMENWWHKKQANPRMQATIDIIVKVAKANDCAVMDMYKVMGGKGSAKKLQQNGLMQGDYVHLTAKGYALQGDLFYNAIWNEIEKNLSK